MHINGVLTIQAGNQTGEAVVKVYKGTDHNDSNLWGSGADAGYQISINIYDPNDLSSIEFLPSTTLEEINMYVGDSTQLDLDGLKNELNFLSAGVSKDGYTLKAYILQSGASVPTYVESNDKISINPETGVITANAVGGDSMVYVVALASGKTASATKYIATLTVNVAAKPAAETELTVAPGAVTLWTDKTYQLTATKTPADAAGNITWSSSATDVATVDGSGKVTAVAEGTATITATCGGATATCVITVKAPCGENHAYVYQECDWGHVKECAFCGDSDNVILDHNIFWKESTEFNGKMYGECLDCGYKTDLVNIPANEVPTDPTPDTPNRPNLSNNPDSSTGGYHSGAGRPYCPDLSTVVPESTTATKPGSTVQSPGTGDAGIVLYAALSMLSMTGGAWLVGRKRREK